MIASPEGLNQMNLLQELLFHGKVITDPFYGMIPNIQQYMWNIPKGADELGLKPTISFDTLREALKSILAYGGGAKAVVPNIASLLTKYPVANAIGIPAALTGGIGLGLLGSKYTAPYMEPFGRETRKRAEEIIEGKSSSKRKFEG